MSDTLPSESSIAQALLLMRRIGTDTQKYEVKESSVGLSKTLPSTLSAFSNGSGGTLILGISEKEGFVPAAGFELGPAQDAIEEMCSSKLTPPVRPDIHPEVFEGAPILVVNVPAMEPHTKPCYVSARGAYNGSFIRTGDGDRRLSRYEVDRLLEEQHQPSYDFALVEEATIDDLDAELLAGLLARERRVHQRNFAALTDEQAMARLNVARLGGDGILHPTLGALVALGSYPQQFFPRANVAFACYPGTDKVGILHGSQRLIDSESINGPVPHIIEDTLAAISRNMRTGAFVDGAFRADVPDYPIVALREALANALMHRDYSPFALGTPVQVDMYADRLEILSPGGLFGNTTLDALGRDGISASRNQGLATLLEATPYADGFFVAENRGTGLQTIFATLADTGMEAPQLRDTITFFSISFMRRRLTASEMHMSVRESVEAVVLSMLENRESVSTTEVVRQSGRARATVVKYIGRMIADGVLEPVERSGSTRQRYRLRVQQ